MGLFSPSCPVPVRLSMASKRGKGWPLARGPLWSSSGTGPSLLVKDRVGVSLKPAVLDHVAALLGDHDDRRVGVARGDDGHDRGVDDPEPVEPVHAQLGVDHRAGVVRGAHPARARLVVLRPRLAANRALPVRVAAEREVLTAGDGRAVHPEAVPLQGGGLREPDGELDAVDEHGDIVGVRQVAREDPRVRERVVGGQAEEAAALGVQHGGEDVDRAERHRVGVAVGALAHLPRPRARREEAAEEELDVGVVVGRVAEARVDEARDLGQPRAGHEPVAEQQVLHGGGPVKGRGVGVVDGEGEEEGHVVVQVAAHAGQVVRDGHVDLLQLLARSDTREQQQLRRVDCAAGHDHLQLGVEVLARAVTADHLNPVRLFGGRVDEDLGDGRVEQDVQVGPVLDGAQEGLAGGQARPVARGGLRDGEARVLEAVHVADGLAHLHGGGQDGVRQRRVVRELGDRQRAADAVQPRVHGVGLQVVLGLEEEGQDVLVAPARVAHGRPVVVVAPAAAHVHHAVEHARPAQHLPSWPGAAPLVLAQARHVLRLRLVLPVDVRAQEVEEHGRNLRARGLVASRLDAQHSPVGVLGQPGGDHGARRAQAHHDEVVLVVEVALARLGPAAGVLQVALRPDEHLEQTHEEHEGGAAARVGERGARPRHRAVALHLGR